MIPIKRVLSIITVILVCLVANGQNRVRGNVVDKADGSAVAGAFVSLYSSSTLVDYAYTDEDGGFEFSFESEGEDLKVEVMMMGYENVSRAISGKAGNEGIMIRMSQKEMEIKPAKLVYRPIKESGDTVDYDVSAFRSVGDRTLEDILIKLPGIEVTQTGMIRYNGSAINKFYIENLDLLGSRYSIATKNLSPDKIESVQVLKNHQPIRVLEGITETDRAAVNIVLKEDEKNTLLFSVDAAGGFGDSPVYDGKLMLSSFSKDKQWLFLLKGNNIGQDITTEMTAHSIFGNGGSVFQVGVADSDFNGFFNSSRTVLPIPLEYYFDNATATATFNHLSRSKRGWETRFNLNFFNERINEAESLSRQVTSGDTLLVSYSEYDEMKMNTIYGSSSLKLERNASELFISNSLDLAGNFRTRDESASSATDVSHRFDLPSFKASDSYRTIFRVKGDNAIEINNDFKYLRNNHQLTFEGSGLTKSPITQTADCRDLSDHSWISYSDRFGNGFTIGGKAYFDLERNRRLTSFNLSGFVDPVPQMSDYQNDLAVFSTEVGLEPFIECSVGRLYAVLKFPFGYEYFGYDRLKDNGSVSRMNYSLSLTMRYGITSKLSMRLNGSMAKTNSDADQLLDGLVFSDYRHLWTNGIVSDGKRETLSYSLNLNDLAHLMNASVTLDWGKITSEKGSAVYYYPSFVNLSLTCPVLYDFRKVMYGANGTIVKRFFFDVLRTELGLGRQYVEENGCLQGSVTDYSTVMDNVSLNLALRPAKWMSLGLKGGYSNTSLRTTGNRVESYMYSCDLRVSPVKRVMLKGEVSTLRQIVPGMVFSNCPLSRIEAEYSLKSLSIFAECRNLFGAKDYSSRSVSTYSSSYDAYALRPRTVVVGIRSSL